jgi:hypothetical protein
MTERVVIFLVSWPFLNPIFLLIASNFDWAVAGGKNGLTKSDGTRDTEGTDNKT